MNDDETVVTGLYEKDGEETAPAAPRGERTDSDGPPVEPSPPGAEVVAGATSATPPEPTAEAAEDATTVDGLEELAGEPSGLELEPSGDGEDEGGPDTAATPASDGSPPDEDVEDGGLGEAAPSPVAMRQMLFVDVSVVLPSTHPVVVLQEADVPYRELRIPVGGAEGVAIGYAARRVATPRPLTHELISRLLDTFDLSLDAVHLTEVHGLNFVAELVVSGRAGVRTIDCRPSDAIALALRRSIPVPIMATAEVLEAAGAGAAGAN